MKRARILLAQEANIIAATTDALHEFEIFPTTTLLQAQRLIEENSLDLFDIGIHFDDSNALELVKYIRESTPHLQTPIVMIRVLPTRLADSLRGAVRAVRNLYAISAYLELEKSTDPSRKLRTTVMRELTKPETNDKVKDLVTKASSDFGRDKFSNEKPY